MIKLLKELLPYVTPHWKKALSAILLSFVLAAVKGAEVEIIKRFIDEGLTGTSEEMLKVIFLLLGVVLINFPARFFHYYWVRYICTEAHCQLRQRIYRKLMKLPMSYYAKSKQGELISNVLNDTMTFAIGFRNLVDMVKEPITGIVLFVILLMRDWQLTLVLVFLAPIFVITFKKTGKIVKNNQRNVQNELANITHLTGEGVHGQKVFKAFNLQNFILGRFKDAELRFFNAQMLTTKIEEIAHPLVEVISGVGVCIVLYMAHTRVTMGAMTTGDFVSFLGGLALINDPIRKFSQANVKLNQARAASERLRELFLIEDEIDNGQKEIGQFSESIEFKNLSFSYGEYNVVKNFSATIKKGEKVALVGLSGSGKSTLINLLLGLYPITEGELLIDGVNIKDIKLSSLRNLFGLVSQDIFLFHDTIENNLRLGMDISKDQLKRALDMAYATEFVNELPEKEETIVGDRGMRLSGGQSQRITIARAFLQDTDILLFDEATSALDNESEKLVQKALEKIAGHKTVIAVAHRLSTIQHFDKILVLSNGELVEEGNHEYLIAQKKEYSKLYELSTLDK
ncbi:MAG: ABC transporter ATP-binding protein [Halobacteriovoraceae bacterium]|nr:ABC transporter ATP-binding protein [Halobacteriovoraceae bacterium]